MRINHIVLIFSLGLLSCSTKLLNPLNGGHSYAAKSVDKKYDSQYRAPAGTMMYLKPKKTLSVRAIEDCRILAVITDHDSAKIIVAKGMVEAGYGNLYKCYVAKGESVLRGQVIGELFAKDSINDNSLAISLQKGGKAILPKW